MRSWGRAFKGSTYLAEPSFQDEVADCLAAASREGLSCLATGLGRSYGDSGLNLNHAAIGMARLDRVLGFNAKTGVLRAEAGLSLSEVIRRVAPHGWFLPTTPGTRFVTLGGAVAHDVHGKNHHRAGAFGASVRSLGLLRSDRGLITIGPELEPELFAATVGGLGLTGLIVWVELQLAPVTSSFLDAETLIFGDLDEFFAINSESVAGFEHTVAWIDCLSAGRGFYGRANWRQDGRIKLHDDRMRVSLPIDLPGFALNPLTLRVLNEAIFRRQQAGARRSVDHYTSAFYPLDAIGGWNRLYGSAGFYQYQCVTPMGAGIEPVRDLLKVISASGEGSFLAVLKTLGAKPSPGLLSFPQEGLTLAIDFSNRGLKTLELFARLDEIVAAAGGRIYPAKDGRMPPAMFAAGYPALPQFIERLDPAFSSSFWRRIKHG
jgi:FAD/FMN-containing dehydrogenase